MRFTMGTGGPPAGTHGAKFARIEEYKENVEKYGAGVRLVWTIVGGDHAGEEATAICSAKLSAKSKLGKFATALNGGPIAAGTEIDFDEYVGVTGMIVVEETEGGGTKVVTFVKTAS